MGWAMEKISREIGEAENGGHDVSCPYPALPLLRGDVL
jgi:hypothetical protein